MVDHLSNVRLAAGTLSQSTLEGSSGYLVNNFATQSDMWTAIQWEAVPVGEVLQTVIPALDGTGNFYGNATGALEFFILTEDMLNYLWANIMEYKPRNAVSLRTYHSQAGWVSYNAILVWPFIDSGGGYIQQHLDVHSNVVFQWERGTVASYGGAFSAAFSSDFG